jgi:hypothetical protein
MMLSMNVLYTALMQCSRCRTAERLQGQRWCRRCLTSYQRERRAKTRGKSGTPFRESAAAPSSCGQTAAASTIRESSTTVPAPPGDKPTAPVHPDAAVAEMLRQQVYTTALINNWPVPN